MLVLLQESLFIQLQLLPDPTNYLIPSMNFLLDPCENAAMFVTSSKLSTALIYGMVTRKQRVKMQKIWCKPYLTLSFSLQIYIGLVRL